MGMFQPSRRVLEQLTDQKLLQSGSMIARQECSKAQLHLKAMNRENRPLTNELVKIEKYCNWWMFKT